MRTSKKASKKKPETGGALPLKQIRHSKVFFYNDYTATLKNGKDADPGWVGGTLILSHAPTVQYTIGKVFESFIHIKGRFDNEWLGGDMATIISEIERK